MASGAAGGGGGAAGPARSGAGASPLGAGAHGTLIHLSASNPILETILGRKVALGGAVEGAEPLEINVGEFDSVDFRIVVPESALHMLYVGVSAPFAASVPADDLAAALKEDFGEFGPSVAWTTSGVDALAEGALASSSLVVSVDTAAFAEANPSPDAAIGVRVGPAGAVLTARLAALRATVHGASLRRALRNCRTDAKSDAVSLKYRAPHEGMWIIPRPGQRVTVIWALDFAEKMDRVVARTICNELVENQRRIAGAPTVHFTDASAPEPPAELRGRPVPKGPGHVGFLALTFEKRHVDSDPKLRNVVDTVVMLRSYFTYHIKAAKAYLHSRMRFRVEELLKVLNRAKPEDPLARKEKKTFAGKTFARKV